nr:MAG TPA: hypothetical protein [Caudoviricetes sp.]
MRPVTSNASFFIANTSCLLRASTLYGIFIQILEKFFQIRLTIGNQ